MKRVILLVLTIIINIYSQENLENVDLFSMSLEDLLNIKTTVSSQTATSLRESPGILSIITKEDIQKSGAKDLIEVLRLIPGFELGVDVEGVVGVSLRGNWAHEGKVLLLVDGQEYNELLYSTLQLGNHFSVDQIERIEIIRGPGSAMYGGSAELGVVNIITKDGSVLDGANISTLYSFGNKGYYRKNLNFSFGKKLAEMEYNIHGFIGDAIRSHNNYTDFNGSTYSMKNNSKLETKNLNIGLSYNNFSFRAILDEYTVYQKDQFGTNFPDTQKAVPMYFNSYFFEGKYKYEFQKLSITSKINYKIQRPWAISDAFIAETRIPDSTYFTSFFNYDFTATRLTGNLSAMYDFDENLNVVFGVEHYWDKGISNNRNSLFASSNPYEVKYNNFAAFFQTLYKHSFANITVGARYDKHNIVGSSFVPRIALTKLFDDLHVKLLYSNSFRAPGIKNIDLAYGGKIKPEKTSVIEAEIGYVINKKYFITANIFDLIINDPIIYFIEYDNNGNYVGEGYKNFTKTGTQGLELQFLTKDTWGKFEVNYSFYQVKENTVTDYIVNTNKKMFIAQPQHKVNLIGSYNITQQLSLNSTLTYISERYSYTSNGQGKVDPITLLNFNVLYNNIQNTQLDVMLGVKNLLDQKYEYIQPYNGGHANLPSSGIEYFIALNLKI